MSASARLEAAEQWTVGEEECRAKLIPMLLFPAKQAQAQAHGLAPLRASVISINTSASGMAWWHGRECEHQASSSKQQKQATFDKEASTRRLR